MPPQPSLVPPREVTEEDSPHGRYEHWVWGFPGDGVGWMSVTFAEAKDGTPRSVWQHVESTRRGGG